jgi:hypothetical protein
MLIALLPFRSHAQVVLDGAAYDGLVELQIDQVFELGCPVGEILHFIQQDVGAFTLGRRAVKRPAEHMFGIPPGKIEDRLYSPPSRTCGRVQRVG